MQANSGSQSAVSGTDARVRLAVGILLTVVALSGVWIAASGPLFHAGRVDSRIDLVTGPLLVGLAGYNVQRLRARRPLSKAGLYGGAVVCLLFVVTDVVFGTGGGIGGRPLAVGALVLAAHLVLYAFVTTR